MNTTVTTDHLVTVSDSLYALLILTPVLFLLAVLFICFESQLRACCCRHSTAAERTPLAPANPPETIELDLEVHSSEPDLNLTTARIE